MIISLIRFLIILGNPSSLVEATGMILENTTVTKTGATFGAVDAIVKTADDAATTDFSNSGRNS